MLAAYPILEPALEKIGARIAVSEAARRTLVAHVGGDAVLIPNGVFVDRFASCHARTGLAGQGGDGRLHRAARRAAQGAADPARRDGAGRRGPSRACGCWSPGRGDVEEVLEDVSPAVREAVTFLGVVSEADKVALLRSA